MIYMPFDNGDYVGTHKRQYRNPMWWGGSMRATCFLAPYNWRLPGLKRWSTFPTDYSGHFTHNAKAPQVTGKRTAPCAWHKPTCHCASVLACQHYHTTLFGWVQHTQAHVAHLHSPSSSLNMTSRWHTSPKSCMTNRRVAEIVVILMKG